LSPHGYSANKLDNQNVALRSVLFESTSSLDGILIALTEALQAVFSGFVRSDLFGFMRVRAQIRAASISQKAGLNENAPRVIGPPISGPCCGPRSPTNGATE
jgi:hypothetical protein